MTSTSNRILPGGMENELQRLPLRFAGVALIGMAIIGWVSLITWTISDPSLNRASPGAANNLLGAGGATMSDMLMQMVGLASVVLFLPVALWGYHMSRGEYIERPRHRLAMLGAAMVLLASTLSMMAKPQGWYLPHGLGGVIGDFGQSFFLRVGGFMEPRLANVIGGIISGYFGAWTLMRACMLTLTELRMLVEFGSSGTPKDKDKDKSSKKPEPIEPRGWFAGSLASASDWMRGVRQQILAQGGDEKGAAAKSGPREYWLAEDPDRFAPQPAASKSSRNGEGSFDTRLNYDIDDEELEQLPRIRRRVPFQQDVSKVELDDGRIEPYFGNGSGTVPAEDPKVTVVPFQAQSRAQTVPQRPQAAPDAQTIRQTPACVARSDEQRAPAARQRAAYVEPPPAPPQRPLPEPFGHDDDEDEDDFDGFDEIPFEAPRCEAPRQAPPRVTAPFRPEIRRPGAQQQSQRGQRSRLDLRHADDDRETPEFVLPSVKLLNPAPPRHTNPELSDVALGRRAEMLQGVLEDFGIKGQITGVHPGPVITLYELEPARGTKSSRVIGLADDIARSMSAVSARVAVIPGRDAIGIELPNQNREVVYLRELLESSDFNSGKARLALALGKTIGGDPITVDLARMPHLLIAGTTGSGKSVAINTMICSLLFRLKPEECRFIMIDPKMLELSVYDGIPHLLTPVVTDPKKAIVALKWTVAEMTSRYERMCKLGVRNILGFNQKVTRAAAQGRPLSRTVQTGFDEDTGSAIYEREDVDCSPMPYIVVVIDEMADLMMVAGKEIEMAVQRLSQMARAAGIHLIMATQRPSVDVITGTIKANFPSRISFQVASKIDSRTILGEMGAEQLLGAGDMLTMAAGGRIMRAHGPFVSDDEVEKIVGYLREQGEPDYLDAVLEDDEPDAAPRRGSKEKEEPLIRQTGDELYDQAVDVVLRERRATTSYLQRRLGVGYNRAASLIEQMEKDGLISAPNRTGKRDILYGEEA